MTPFENEMPKLRLAAVSAARSSASTMFLPVSPRHSSAWRFQLEMLVASGSLRSYSQACVTTNALMSAVLSAVALTEGAKKPCGQYDVP